MFNILIIEFKHLSATMHRPCSFVESGSLWNFSYRLVCFFIGHHVFLLHIIIVSILFRYGDRAPKSIAGRIFGIIWTLTGLVIISILIGAIASSLTTVTVEKEIMLYGTEVSRSISSFPPGPPGYQHVR